MWDKEVAYWILIGMPIGAVLLFIVYCVSRLKEKK